MLRVKADGADSQQRAAGSEVSRGWHAGFMGKLCSEHHRGHWVHPSCRKTFSYVGEISLLRAVPPPHRSQDMSTATLATTVRQGTSQALPRALTPPPANSGRDSSVKSSHSPATGWWLQKQQEWQGPDPEGARQLGHLCMDSDRDSSSGVHTERAKHPSLPKHTSPAPASRALLCFRVLQRLGKQSGKQG